MTGPVQITLSDPDEIDRQTRDTLTESTDIYAITPLSHFRTISMSGQVADARSGEPDRRRRREWTPIGQFLASPDYVTPHALHSTALPLTAYSE